MASVARKSKEFPVLAAVWQLFILLELLLAAAAVAAIGAENYFHHNFQLFMT